MTRTTQPAGPPDLAHLPGCTPPRRLETTHHPAAGITIDRCVECGDQVAHNSDGTLVPPPTATGPFAGSQAFGAGVGFERPDGAA